MYLTPQIIKNDLLAIENITHKIQNEQNEQEIKKKHTFLNILRTQ
jgi:hypothetical protein